MRVDLRVEGLDRIRKWTDQRLYTKVSSMAINKTIAGMKAKASSEIRNEEGWNIKARDFNKGIAMTRSTAAHLWAVIYPERISAATDRKTGRNSFSLPYFGAMQILKTKVGVKTYSKSKHGGLQGKLSKRTRKHAGVHVKVKKSGRTAFFPRAFIARMPSGHLGVYRRDQGDNLIEVKVVSLAMMFKNILPALQRAAPPRYRKEFRAAWLHFAKTRK